jgi:hypothetical protein
MFRRTNTLELMELIVVQELVVDDIVPMETKEEVPPRAPEAPKIMDSFSSN